MSEVKKANIICFEKHHLDDSGVEFSVRYDRKPYLRDESIIGFITLEHVGDICTPVTQLDWLIESLTRIRSEM